MQIMDGTSPIFPALIYSDNGEINNGTYVQSIKNANKYIFHD